MDLSALPARERILLTAHDLFYADGIRATGIDRVIAASAVTKVTFYRHFPSKDDLVRAFLDHRHARWMAWFVDALGRRGAHERSGDAQALLLLADVMAEWFADPVFRGCAFINAVAEVGGSVEGAAERARDHKREMVEVIADLLPATLPQRMALAQAAAIGIDGAIVKAQMGGAELVREAVEDLRRLLRALADAAAPTSPPSR
ncbi:TetR family transcriptional regulator [Variovorax paradoxus]|uniref:TetR/AcrR family transcriptional regulator n=1 Tax=Variovorax TaxID=34072 RepID=UPI0006E67331|nr:TetR/AcrR family transcriptional regulator [Variovorax sp.]KPU94740.1 TetR family transcriptional regulator [Variovorax paradoxus]KPV08929.1 TetR family transcriptional regulator [Variovorax paradoxus]KPV11427.1 TetR family transcriptional regulator [Variovorax paradoxus]KPV23316.1 TetR family transcriptional regulator [Variovorax paradoxus]KPV26790.1 TetR family transcriptional regulator [Variovorax paradoxus]